MFSDVSCWTLHVCVWQDRCIMSIRHKKGKQFARGIRNSATQHIMQSSVHCGAFIYTHTHKCYEYSYKYFCFHLNKDSSSLTPAHLLLG